MEHLTSTHDVTPDTTSGRERPTQAAEPHTNLRVAPKRPELTRIADSLEDEYQIGFHRDHPRSYRRYVHLRSQEIFDRLHTLYRRMFNAHWQHFRRLVEAFELPVTFTSHLSYASACYISSWFWDLYVSNRRSVEKLSASAFIQHFHTPQAFAFEQYDAFLTHLNSVIRPTHIQLSLEDTLYIPLICRTYNWESQNPFGITNFTMNEDLVHGILELMEHRNSSWKVDSLSHDTLGRPMWLLDWRKNQAYTWFPEEGNFTREDLIAAHILGIPCSPRLGPRDFDDWQFFPGGALPANHENLEYQRSTNRNFYGAAEYRTIVTDRYTFPDFTQLGAHPGSKRATTEPKRRSGSGGSSQTEAPMEVAPPEGQEATQQTRERPFQAHRFKIIDWCYYGRVILDCNTQKQNAALRSFVFKKD